MKGTSGEMHTLIASAKSRMKSGFWTDFIEKREEDREKAKQNGESVEMVDSYYKKLIKYKISETKLKRSEEELYKKICEMYESGACVINPIAELIDKDYMATLNYNESQRYILNLSATYRKLLKRYEMEKNFR